MGRRTVLLPDVCACARRAEWPLKQRSDHSIGSRWRRLGLPWRLTAFVSIVVMAVVAGSWLVRTDRVARPLAEARLGAWGERLGGQVAVESIRPIGWTGVRFEGITFTPDDVDRSEPLARVEVVDVFADPRALLSGDVHPRHVSIRGVVADVALDLGDDGDARWLRTLVEDASASDDGEAGDESAPPVRPLPSVELVDARGVLRDAAGVAPTLGATVERMTLARDATGALVVDGGVAIDGVGRARVSGIAEGPERALTLRMLDDNDLFALLPGAWAPSSAATFSVGAVSASWPPRLTLGPVSLRQMNIALPHNPEWRLDDLWLQEAVLEVTDDGWRLVGEPGRIGLSGLLSETRLRLASVELSGERSGALTAAVVRIGEDAHPLTMRWIDEPGQVGVDIVAAQTDVAPWGRLLPAVLRTRLIEGRLDGHARVVRDGQAFAVDVDLAMNDGAARIGSLSSNALRGIDAAVEASVRIDAAEGALDVTSAFARLGAIHLEGRGQVRRVGTGHRLEVEVAVPPVDAGQALAGVPAGLFEALDGLALHGPVHGALRAVVNTQRPEASRIDVRFDADKVSVVAFGDAAPIDRLQDEDFFWWVETFEGSPRPVGPGTDEWVALADMGEILPRAVMAAEDDAFYLHAGFDPRGIRAALQANLEAGRFVRGGSTITQQVVKNLFLSHERTIGRKLQEAVLTWLTERYVDKDRILEFYVNLAHWGPGIYGIHDASLRYFRHVPRQLTLRESAFLASILPNPALFGEQYGRQVIGPSRRVKMGNILRNLERAGLLGADDVAYHLQMIDRGMISTTPPPPDLGPPGSDDLDGGTPSLARGDTLLLFP